MFDSKFKYSIIVAIYNVAEFIEDMAESVINQSIGFKDNIQLILVNDGSSDHSGEICEKLQQKHPENIVYLYQDNAGVSAARNNGLKYATGEYINFLDGDDLLAHDAIEKVDQFFEENKEEIDLVAIPLKIFGREGIHPLDYKFKSTRIVDIDIDYMDIQLSSSSTFIKKSAIEGLCFDEEMKYAEDAKLLTQIILEKKKYGIVHDAIYHYRRREDGSSATQSGSKDKAWYHKYLDTFSLSLIDYSLSKLGHVPEYVQYLIMYDIQWRMNLRASNVLTEEEINSYFDKLQEILQYIDIRIIYEMKSLNIHRKNYLYALKEKKSFPEIFTTRVYRDDVVLLNPQNRIIGKLSKQKPTIELMYEEFGELVIEGNLGSQFDSSQYEIVAQLNGEFINVEKVDRTSHNMFSLNRLVKEYKGFKIKIPVDELKNGSAIQLFAECSNKLLPLKLAFGRLARINAKNKLYYTVLKTLVVEYKNGSLFLYKNTKKTVINKELRSILYRGIKNKGFNIKDIATRLLWLVFYLFKKKSIWLLMDRQDKADDNAEHLFKYLLSIKDDSIKPVYVIKKDSPDYNRMKQIGTVVGYRSFKHKLYFLLSDKLISSHCDEWVINPLFSEMSAYSNLYNYDFIFLQHGVTQANVSNWLNKYRKNIRRIVSTSEMEARGFLEYDYNYNKTDVSLSGFPRYDNLKQDIEKKKQILLMPSWRKHLVKPKDQLLAERPYNPFFKKSDYFDHYNSIINDERLLSEAKRLGYTIMFVPHPDIMVQLDDFDKNDYVKWTDYKTSYQTYFKESALMLTDYSSVFFDFAYMKKPVIYFQYDQEDFHYEKGYFDFEKMGFGEVITDRQKVIDLIIEYMNNDCLMKDEYIERVNSFFKYTDHHNCKRVYDNILAIDQPRREES